MKNGFKFILGVGAIAVVLLTLEGPYRLRRLEHNFDFVQTAMPEAQVSEILGERGKAQPCASTAKAGCDHQLVYHLRSKSSLVIDIDKSGRVLAKSQIQ